MVAFEPHPDNVAAIQQVCTDNGLDNVRIESVALSNENTTGGLEIKEDVSSHRLDTGSEDDTVDVDIVRCDDYISIGKIPKPDVVKMDIEGAEVMALRGMGETLSNCRAIYVETHLDHTRDYGDAPDDVRDILSEYGFDVETIYARRRGEFVRGLRQPRS